MGISYDPPSKKWNVSYEKVDYKVDNPTDAPTNLSVNNFKTIYVWSKLSGGNTLVPREVVDSDLNVKNTKINKDNKDLNALNSKLNIDNTALNQQNTYKNLAYDKTVTVASYTNGGDYTAQREAIRNIANVDSGLKSTLENYYKAFYSNEKLQQWDPRLGAKPPYGEFDSSYYKTQSPAAAQQWASAVANDDIDITQNMVRVVSISSTIQPKASLPVFAGTKQRLPQRQMNT
jgi:hypothetical protein